jgi:Zn-dependent protease with chaperone function
MTTMPDDAASTAAAAYAADAVGRAIYFDGTSSARHEVVIDADDGGLRIFGADGRELDHWRYGELHRLSAPDGVLRLGRTGETLLARLEVRDAALASAIEDRAPSLDRGGAADRRLRRKVVGFSFAAIVSVIGTAIFGLPALTTRLVPYVPVSVEKKLGLAVDKEVRSSLDTHQLGAGFACTDPAGQGALDALTKTLAAGAALPVPIHIEVVRRNEPNAFALPGGHIYLFQGLITRAQSPDELAGVLAHEVGHVAHRDGTRTVLQAAGLSFLFGMMLGDFVGGGAVVIAAKTVLRSSYSRHVEADADTYSVGLMGKIGGDQRALAAILARIVSDKEEGLKILRDHPETKERISAINAMATGGPGAATPLLDAAQWRAVKAMCGTPAAKG